MKKSASLKMLAWLVTAGLVSLGSSALAQEGAATNAPVQVAAAAIAPRLSAGARQILQLIQAKVSDDTILAFVRNTRINFALDAPAIIYLRQQGVSDLIITAMLTPPPALPATTNAPTAALSAPQPVQAPAPQPVAATSAPASDATVVEAPATVYVETPPPEIQYYYQPNYYQVYGYYPPATFSIGIYGVGHGGYGVNHSGGNVGGHSGGNSNGGHGGGYGGGNYHH